MTKTARVQMYHPTKKDSSGNPAIVTMNPLTVRKGMAAKMGYIPVTQPEKAPEFDIAAHSPKPDPKPTTTAKVTPSPKQTAKHGS